MNYDNKFATILNKYNPTDKRTHSILKFLAEELTEDEKFEFVTAIFDKGSWILPTEICNSSESNKLKDDTKNKFYRIFNEWVTKRIEHSLVIPQNIKNPTIPHTYISEYREALISTKNLNFPIELMLVFERFLKECKSIYAKNIFNDSFRLVIEEFNTEEIEKFFTYFSKQYIINNSSIYGNFLYSFLNNLRYSHKIFDLSPDFLLQLSILSSSFKEKGVQYNYSNVISILLIELIIKKELDLSNSNFDTIIEDAFNELEKGRIENLDFFRFLKHFNYSFKKFDFNLEIKTLFEQIETNIYLANNSIDSQKKGIVHHYVNSSEQYFELLLFYLEYFSEELVKMHFINFIKLVDELRKSFSSLLWFEEFLNFNTIYGRIETFQASGFNIKIDEDFFNKKIDEKQLKSFCTNEFVLQNGLGFLHNNSLKEFSKTSELYSLSGINLSKLNKQIILDNSKTGELEPFLISNVNYSTANKGCVTTLIPLNKSLYNKILKYELKSFFPSIELYFTEKSHEYLKLESPFKKRTNSTDRIFKFKFNNDYLIKLSEENFWSSLEQIRPSLYEAIYLNYKKNEETFKELVYAYENEIIISGLVESRTNGGLFVNILGEKAFLPGSQIDIKPIRDYDIYIGKTMDFKIVKVYPEFKNVVVSHKILKEKKVELQKNKTLFELEKGQVLEGNIKNITSFGVFIDLGGFDGLIHITDLSWNRINHPSEILVLDQKLDVLILDFDDKKTRIQLGLKQLKPDPWKIIDSKFTIGQKVNGKVVVIADYGAFIEIAEGVEGLIHVSEMSWSTHLHSARDFVKIGDIIEAVILTFDRDERKISLGIKQLSEDPWTDIPNKYPEGSKHKGIVKNLTSFGVFIELEEVIDGLIYISDLSWTKKIKHPSEFVNLGEKLDVVVLELDIEGRKLTLGHKQTTINPWDDYENLFKVGTIHNGEISEIVSKGATLEFRNDLVAFIPASQLTKKDGGKLKKGDFADFKVIEFNKEFKRVVVSHTDIFRKVKDRNLKKYSIKKPLIYSKTQTSTLDISENNLEALKAKFNTKKLSQ